MRTTITDINAVVPTSPDFIKDLETEQASVHRIMNTSNSTVTVIMNHHKRLDVIALLKKWNDIANQSNRV